MKIESKLKYLFIWYIYIYIYIISDINEEFYEFIYTFC